MQEQQNLVFPLYFQPISQHPFSWSGADSFDVLLLTLLEGSRERTCGTVFAKSAVGHSDVLGLHTRSPLTHCLTSATSGPASSVHGQCYTCISLFIICTIFLLYLLCVWMCLDTQILTIVLQLPTGFSTVMCCTSLQSRTNKLRYILYSLGV